MGLIELADAIERLTDLETAYAVSLNDMLHDLLPEPKCVQPPNYLASIDAALTLVPDGWAIEISVDFVGGARATLFPQGNAYYGQVKALAATAALALCVSALRASDGAKP